MNRSAIAAAAARLVASARAASAACIAWFDDQHAKPPGLGHAWRLFAWTLFCGAVSSCCVPSLVRVANPLLGSAFSYFWFAILTRKRVSSANTFLLLCLTCGGLELVLLMLDCCNWLSFSAFTIALLTVYDIRPLNVSRVIAFSCLVRVLSLSNTWLSSSSLRPLATLAGGVLGVVAASFVETRLRPKLSAILATEATMSDPRLAGLKRRRSSSSLRRTSLPVSLSSTTGTRTTSHGNVSLASEHHHSNKGSMCMCSARTRSSSRARNSPIFTCMRKPARVLCSIYIHLSSARSHAFRREFLNASCETSASDLRVSLRFNRASRINMPTAMNAVALSNRKKCT